MRYFKTVLGTSAQQIEEKAKVRLRDYSYDSPIVAVNVYIHKNMRNMRRYILIL